MIRTLRSQQFWRDFDWPLLAAAILLCIIGLVEIYSSTLNFGSAENYFVRQLAWIGVGVVFLFVVAAFDYRVVSEHIPLLYVLSVLVLIYTVLFGHTVSGAASWIAFGPMSFQPSEPVKLVVTVALARYLSELGSDRYIGLGKIVKTGAICGVPMALVFLQPDLGTALTYLPALACGLFIRGLRPAAWVSLLLVVILVLPVSWSLLKDYQKDRIFTFVHPESDPLGAGYQVIQSKIAIGSGGLIGMGLFRGSQNQLGFLPTRHTDFILSVVGEEMGFLGIAATLGLLAFIVFRSIYTAQTARDSLGVFIVMGVVGIFLFHIIVNVGMVIGLMPITGIPLPFLSYGGSAILTAFIGLGLVISVRRCRYVN